MNNDPKWIPTRQRESMAHIFHDLERAKAAWSEHAICRTETPKEVVELFMANQPKDQTQLATELCGDCPVRRPCLHYALTAGEKYGLWGGIPEKYRAVFHAELHTTYPGGMHVLQPEAVDAVTDRALTVRPEDWQDANGRMLEVRFFERKLSDRASA